MKSLIAKILAGLVLGAVMSACGLSVADAATVTKTLEENTRISPPGMIVATAAEIPKFQKGTVVILNENGEVLEGILADDISLPYESGSTGDSVRQTSTTYMPTPMIIYSYAYLSPPNRLLLFKGGTKVSFNDKGEVYRGTLSGSNQNIALNLTNHITASDGPISFYKTGMVVTCTLAGDTYLRPLGWEKLSTVNNTAGIACQGFVEFKGGKTVMLNENGEVVKGTLNKNTKLLTIGALSLDVITLKNYEAGTTVELDEKGIVLKASK